MFKTFAGGGCEENLHSYWDSAGGYLHHSYSARGKVEYLQERYPSRLFLSHNRAFLPETWASESYQAAGIAYQAHKNGVPRFQEKEVTQAISKKQLALAGYRLAGVLSHVS